MTHILEIFIAYKEQNQLFAADDKLLLAVSGGLDSVAMVHLCHQARLDFAIAHCNFQLRAGDADEDEDFVKSLALKYEVPFFSVKFETKKYANSHGISTQMAARELRYEWFEKIRIDNNYDYLLTAHHKNDLTETVLLNLVRGTGLAGLHGIRPKVKQLIRPLLFAKRSELETYIKDNGLTWREDSSNQSDDYQRNLIRHKIVPVLETMNPRLLDSVHKTTERIANNECILAAYFEEKQIEWLTHKPTYSKIDCQRLETLVEPVEHLAYWLRQYEFSYEQAKEIWKSRAKQSGTQFLSQKYSVTIDRETLILVQRLQPAVEPIIIVKGIEKVSTPLGNLEISYTDVLSSPSNQDSFTAYFDGDLIQYPLTLRLWRRGDFISPLGMSGKRKKVSNILIDNKVPLPLKEQILVLESNHQIVWIVGIRTSDLYKISDCSKNYLKIKYFK